MNNAQNNKLTMYEFVLETFNTYNSVWKNTIVISESVAELSSIVSQMRKAGAIKVTSTKGITQAKLKKKIEMAERASKLAGLTSAYAVKTKNIPLQAALNYSYSELFQSKENLAIDQCTAIYDQIRPVLSELKPYGITSADLEIFQGAIAAYKGFIGQKGQQQSGQKSTTQVLENLFNQADTLLKTQLDKLMLRYKNSNQEFYDAYIASRILRNVGGNRKTVTSEAA